MYSFLPDELLKEILAPALQVPDDAFACTIGKSPFSNYNPTTSGFLLVCKDWLRVATPLLYSVVVLRSKAQIQALESAITTTPILAGYIRKLRIECGYCSSLLKILKGAKNLTDLCLSLEIYSSDNVTGFCKGLAFIHPHRLIIYDLERPSNRPLNKKTEEVTKALQHHIPDWDKLTRVTVPWFNRWSTSLPKPEDFIVPICKCKSIEIVTIQFQNFFRPWIKQLAKVPTLRKIIVASNHPIYLKSSEFSQGIDADPRLKALVKYEIMRQNTQLVEENSVFPSSKGNRPPKGDFIPKGTASFPDNVWFNILFYASGIPELEQSVLSELTCTTILDHQPRSRQRLALVCKKFFALVMPLYYRCITIHYERDSASIIRFLSRNLLKGQEVKTLLFHYQLYINNSSTVEDVHKLFRLTPNIQRFSTGLSAYCNTEIFDWQALSILAQTSGPRLVELSIHLRRPNQPKTPDAFYHFTALKHLHIVSSLSVTYDPAKLKKNALPNLESVTSLMSNDTLLLFLSNMDLPKLRKARFPSMEKCDGAITFLRHHGNKLQSLECGFLPGVCIFIVCPNLKEFEVPRDKPGFTAAEFFFSDRRHPLEKLHIKTDIGYSGTEKEKFRYLGRLHLSNFTSLHEIRVNRCVWPTTENEIKKSHWVAWAERLQELYQVDIVDKTGQKWVPRLKAKRDK